MQHNTYLWLGAGIVIALLLAGGILFLRPGAAVAPTGGAATAASSTGSTTSVNLGNGITATAPTGVTITPVSSTQEPNLNYQAVYSASLAPDVITALQAQIAMLAASLKTNPAQEDDWLQLAIDYKTAGDYAAAANVWIYLTEVVPNDYVPFADLGDLYQNFVVNYPKAETNYLAALKLAPGDIDLYRDLYTLYRYEYKTGTEAAANIIAQGLKANPGNPDLLQMQASLQ